MEKNTFKFRLLAISSIIILCIGNTLKFFQNDTFYMIKLGDYIIHHGIDFKDHWCWVTRLPYTYPHWLYDIYSYFVYINFGYLGIYISVIIVFIILVLVIYYINLKINKNEFMGFFIAFLSTFLLAPGITMRAQSISYILFILEVYFILMLIRNGNKIYILLLFIISVLVANIHATIWPFVFVLFLPFFGEQLIWGIKNKFNIKINDKLIIDKVNNNKLLICSFIFCFLGGVLTPNGIGYTYFFKIILGNSQSFITEHAPLVIFNYPIFLLLFLVVVIVLIFTKTKIKLYELFMLCGLFFMGLSSNRHVMLFNIIGVLFISIIVMRYFNESKDKTFNTLFKLITNSKLIYGLFIIIVVLISGIRFYNNSKYDYVPNELYPVDAVNYIKNNLDYKNIKLYNSYDYGSYLMFNDIPIFIDSRCDLYLKEFNGKDVNIIYDGANIISNYDKIVNKYKFEYALINKNYVIYEIIKRTNVDIVYEDKYFVLFKIN